MAASGEPIHERDGAVAECGGDWHEERQGDSAPFARRRPSCRSADGPHLAAPCASAEELIAPIGLEPRHFHSARQLEALQDLARSRIDASQLARLVFPRGVPELFVDPRDPTAAR